MLLCLVSTIVAAPLAGPEQQANAVVRQATASVRIERPVTANRIEWERLPKASRREIIVRGEHGEPVIVRLIENE
jgi:hypothetical protein